MLVAGAAVLVAGASVLVVGAVLVEGAAALVEGAAALVEGAAPVVGAVLEAGAPVLVAGASALGADLFPRPRLPRAFPVEDAVVPDESTEDESGRPVSPARSSEPRPASDSSAEIGCCPLIGPHPVSKASRQAAAGAARRRRT